MMIAHTNRSRSSLSPIQQWEDDGGAIPSTSSQAGACCQVNVGQMERIISGTAGGALLLYGLLVRPGLSGLLPALLGGGLLYRGVTGHCHLYESLDISTAEEEGNLLTGEEEAYLPESAIGPSDEETSRFGQARGNSRTPAREPSDPRSERQSSGNWDSTAIMQQRETESKAGAPPAGRT